MFANRLLYLVPLVVSLAACGSNETKDSAGAQRQTTPSVVTTALPSADIQTKAYRPPSVGGYYASALSGDYAGYASTRALIDRLDRDYGFDRNYLYGVFSRVERQDWILDYLNRPKSKAPPRPGGWTRYRAKFITDDRIAKGNAFWDRYEYELQRAYGRYGVPPEIIVAIIGVETHYGVNVGSHKVIEALSTLAFDYPRRSKFFSDELVHFFEMSRNEGMDPFRPIGSYAGAMGLGQFMPSSFHKYAVDFDGDGPRDLWNPVDAIGSVANYFAGHGWRNGEPVAFSASASGPEPRLMKAGFNSRYSPATLERKGVRSRQSLDGHNEVSLIRLNATFGPEYWVGLHNFYVISRYNHSTYYSMAVYQLSEAVKQSRSSGRGPVVSALDFFPLQNARL